MDASSWLHFAICNFFHLLIILKEPGRGERSFARYDCLTVLKKFLLTTWPHFLAAPHGVEIVDFFPTPSVLPSWITEDELMVFADKFHESGFTGAFNYYRVMDLNWELLATWQGSKITVRTKFITGDKDFGFESGSAREFVEGDVFKSIVPDLEVVILDGHHFIHQEKAQEVSDEILYFIHKLSQH